MTEKLHYYFLLMRMDKPIGSLLLLWPTLWALWFASNGRPPSLYLWVFALGVLVMRSAGCVINDVADRHIDPLVARTQQRPLAAGLVTVQEALWVFMLLCMLALLLLIQLPVTVWPWSLLALGLTIVYPFMKRFIQAPQVVLSLAFSVSMPMAYVTMGKPFDTTLLLLLVINFFWVLMFDTQYAMSDREDDLKIGVKSTAILFGHYDKVVISCLQLVIIVLLIALMHVNNLAASFWLSIVMVIGLFAYQASLISRRERQACLNAFLNNAWVGAIIWFGLLTAVG